MPAAELYRRQVALLVKVISLVAAEPCFALKGGTAINLFIRNMPRLSVDIDLTYLPVADRSSSLKGIDAAMGRIGDNIAAAFPMHGHPEHAAERELHHQVARAGRRGTDEDRSHAGPARMRLRSRNPNRFPTGRG
jgi:hypothetical protein